MLEDHLWNLVLCMFYTFSCSLHVLHFIFHVTSIGTGTKQYNFSLLRALYAVVLLPRY